MQQGKLVGIVKRIDIEDAPGVHGLLAGIFGRLVDRRVNQYMKTGYGCIGPDSESREALELMRRQSTDRLYVTENDRLLGIVSRGDLDGPLDPRQSGANWAQPMTTDTTHATPDGDKIGDKQCL